MAITTAEGSKVLRTFALETTPGTAPAAAYATLRVKSGVSTDFTRNTFVSQEVRSDRQVSSLSYGTKQGAVSLPVEWSYGGTFDTFIEAVLGGTWTANVVKVGNVRRTFAIEEKNTDIGTLERVTGAQFGGFSISQKIDGIAEGEITGVYRGIKIAQTRGVNLAYDATGKTITRPSGSFIEDGWMVGDGVVGSGNADSGNNNTTQWVITTLTATVMTFTTAAGIVTAASTSGITLNLGSVSTSITAPTTNAPFDSFAGSVTIGGALYGTITGWSLNVSQDIDLNFVLGSDAAQGSSVRTINVTGTITAYFTDESLRKQFVNGMSTSLSLELGSASTGRYQFDLGTVKHTSITKNSDDGPILQTLNFTATYDSTNASTIEVTRIAAA